jgi:hypothetical protein
MTSALSIRPVEDAGDRRAFVDLAFELNREDPNWVPPLKTEVHGLIDPRTNPWFDHAEARFFLAERDGRAVGRISAQVDQEVLQYMGPGIGQWGMFEAADAEVAAELIARAEDFLRGRRMQVAQGPYSLSIWDEPGLLVEGFDHPPTVMMGHNKAEYQGWIEGAGYKGVKDLYTYDLDITVDFPPLVKRIIESGERNPRIRIRKVSKKRFEEEAALILGILNDAWSDNWGFIPLSEEEIAYVGKKLKPIVFEDLIRVAEVDGEPVAFMITLPDLNEFTRGYNGRLFPFNWRVYPRRNRLDPGGQCRDEVDRRGARLPHQPCLSGLRKAPLRHRRAMVPRSLSPEPMPLIQVQPAEAGEARRSMRSKRSPVPSTWTRTSCIDRTRSGRASATLEWETCWPSTT